jgi:hypothetical protein
MAMSINSATIGQIYADFLAYEVRNNNYMADYIKDLNSVQHFYDHLKIGLFLDIIDWLRAVGAREHLMALKRIMEIHEAWEKDHEQAARLG